jgi:hydrogenase nickel incorporation protein HypA/HybF
MHELSIALSILDLAAEEAERQGGGRVVAVHLRLGPLCGVVKEALASAYELACEAGESQPSRLVIEEVPIVVHCPTCAGPRALASTHVLCCPDCGTPTPEILSGRELEVVALEVET